MICPTPGGEARTGDQHKSVGRRNPIRIRITDPLSCLGRPCGNRVPTRPVQILDIAINPLRDRQMPYGVETTRSAGCLPRTAILRFLHEALFLVRPRERMGGTAEGTIDGAPAPHNSASQLLY